MGPPHNFIIKFTPNKFNFKMVNRISQRNKGCQKASFLLIPQPGLRTYKTYTYKYLLNWELKKKFALKMANVGSFIVYAAVRESWFDKTSFQNSNPKGTSPSTRTCFSLPVPWDQDSQEHLSIPSLIPETKKRGETL